MIKPTLSLALAAWLALSSGAYAAPGAPEIPIDPDTLPQASPSVAPTAQPPVSGQGVGEPITGFRFAYAPEAASLEISLPHAVTFQERATASAWQLFLPGLTAQDLPGLGDSVLVGLRARNQADGVTLEIPWQYWCPTDIQPLDEGRRLVITFRKIYREEQQEVLARGVVHLHRRSADADGPLNIHVLRVDPRQPGVRLMPGMAGSGGFFSREPVSAIARRHGALAGVNGSYFSMKTGEPLGLLMIDHELVSAPIFNRTALAIGEHGDLFIGNTQLSARVTLPTGETYDLDGVNQARGQNRMVLYTPRFGTSTRTAPGGHEYSLASDGTLLAEGEADMPIPPLGYVLSAHGQPAEWLARSARVGTRLALSTPLEDYWPGVRHALGGGPTLLRGGELAVGSDAEQFKADIARGTAPRTAVGLTAAGEVLLVTVDGRQANLSRGLTLLGLANLMRELGASEAMNLDGGGSTAMAIGASVVNHPSDGAERAVNNALLIFADPLAGTGAIAPNASR